MAVTMHEAQLALRRLADPELAKFQKRFFKTGPGEYGEGDQFLGLKVPQVRMVAKKFRELPLTELKLILHSKWHEDRLLALIILTLQYPKSSSKKKLAQF